MATTKEELSIWFDEGVAQGATHMVIKCDTFDYSDYPKFVMPDDDLDTALIESNMQTNMECYDLSMDKETQLHEYRAWHLRTS